jgi:dTMP kinase
MDGLFIVLEGGEGAGKSSVLTALAARLRAHGADVVETREPGGTPLGERIREILLAADDGGDALTELLLFEAARAHHVATLVRPALDRGALVLCDRFTASSVAYQGVGRGLGHDVVERANSIATGGLEPHRTLLLDLPAADGLRRRAADGGSNHFDRASLEFHQRVRDAFLQLARERPDTWRIVDAAQPFDDVVAAAWAAIEPLLAERAEGAKR